MLRSRANAVWIFNMNDCSRRLAGLWVQLTRFETAVHQAQALPYLSSVKRLITQTSVPRAPSEVDP